MRLYAHIKTDQQAFDAVCKHLAKQKRQALHNLKCDYLTTDGERCAIGGIMPLDSARLARDDGGEVGDLPLSLGEVSVDLLRRLQLAHDDDTNLEGLQNELRLTARNFGLSADAVDLITEWYGDQ